VGVYGPCRNRDRSTGVTLERVAGRVLASEKERMLIPPERSESLEGQSWTNSGGKPKN